MSQELVTSNTSCWWDESLVGAVGSVQLVGWLVGGWLVIGGPERHLTTLVNSYANSLLHPPHGYTIVKMGK